MQISVIICTHNPKEDYLHRVLDALRAQTLSAGEWEVLLVDNASEVPLAGNFDLSWHPRGKIVREEKLGKMYAWLRAIREAGGDILIFVDDDNVLDPAYLEKALEVANEFPFVGAWGGSVIPEFESEPPSWAKEQMWRLSVEEVREDIWSNLREGFETKPLGAGMCVRKAVSARYLEWCGVNEASNMLDRRGKSDAIAGYGDMNLALCAVDIGLGTGKFARLRLTHLIPSTRLTLDYFLRHAEGDAASLILYRAIRGLPIKESSPTLFQKIKWQVYKRVSKQPREVLQIHECYLRGIRRGLDLVRDYMKVEQ